MTHRITHALKLLPEEEQAKGVASCASPNADSEFSVTDAID
jgi:hypothetical protein